MYVYEPKSPKKPEKLTVAVLLLVGLLLFLMVAAIPTLPFPSILQLCGVFFLAGAILILSQCLLRHYTYCIDLPDGAGEGAIPDLTVSEYYSRRVSVVCRISLADIESAVLVTAENKKSLSAMLKKKRVYRYLACLTAENICLLTVRDGDEIFYVRILADKTLLSLLQRS